MTVNINPNYDANAPANELYNTQIPALSENANIQEALRVYHYGVGTGLPTTTSQIQEQSVAGHLKKIRTDITTLQNKGLGSSYSTNEPTSVDNGFVWVDADSAAPIFGTPPATIPSVVRYQNAAPTTNISDGTAWVDKDTVTKDLHIYDAALSQWVLVNTGAVARYQAGQPTLDLKVGQLWVDAASATVDLYVYTGVAWKKIGGPA